MAKTSENFSMVLKCLAYKLRALELGVEESLGVFLTLKEGTEEEQIEWLLWLEDNNPSMEEIYEMLNRYIELKRETEPTFMTGG